eukprot:jgi/Mesvir1/19642/Mv09925-RA.1
MHTRSLEVATKVSRECIVPLPPALRDELLPISATGEQYAYYWGGFDTISQRLALSLLGTMICYGADNVLLSVFMAFFWLWAPVAYAAKRNLSIKDLKFPGIWEARVVQVSFAKRASTLEEDIQRRGDDMFSPVAAGRKYMKLVLGDPSGFAIEVEVPSQREFRQIRVGDAAQMLILSDQPSLRRFNVLRDVFLPDRRLWVSQYPHIHRAVYESVSDSMPVRLSREPPSYKGPNMAGTVADFGDDSTGWGDAMAEGQGGGWDGVGREPGGGDGGEVGGGGWRYRQGSGGGLVRRGPGYDGSGYAREGRGRREGRGGDGWAGEPLGPEDSYRYGSSRGGEDGEVMASDGDSTGDWRAGGGRDQWGDRGKGPSGEGRLGQGDGGRAWEVDPVDEWDDRSRRKRQLPDDW